MLSLMFENVQPLDLLFTLIAVVAVGGAFIFSIDDLWMDAYAFFHELGPDHLDDDDLGRLHTNQQKHIAIMIANWHEEDVIERMIIGNIAHVDYINYTFFLGVYPNDTGTWEIANKLAAKYSRVQVVVNPKPGPTSKGQMLNEIVRTILGSEFSTGIRYDAILMQDSEDVLHPLSLKLFNDSLDTADFVQIPVFSFNLSLGKFVGGTYIDEFSEIHTKDLLVRERMGAAIPSAGVGTAMSRRLVVRYLEEQNGDLLKEDTLTEDYHLGLMAKERGFKSRFVCAYRMRPKSGRDFVATREYFPSVFKNSVKQKTRWTLGIAFQGSDNIGWNGDIVDLYFLFRDRRGPLNSILILLSLMTLALFVSYKAAGLELPVLVQSPMFSTLTALTMTNMIVRIIQRIRSVALVNGAAQAMMVPLRWPVANLINFLAAWNAFTKHRVAIKTGTLPKWDKTTHELPADFGSALPQYDYAPVVERTAHAPPEAQQ